MCAYRLITSGRRTIGPLCGSVCVSENCNHYSIVLYDNPPDGCNFGGVARFAFEMVPRSSSLSVAVASGGNGDIRAVGSGRQAYACWNER